MIKADGPAKVKRASLQKSILTMVVVYFLASTSISAQESEQDIQSMEQQEFGIDPPQSPQPEEARPAPQPERTEMPPPADYQPEAAPEKIKPIEAEEFRVHLKKTSRSGRVLLLEDSAENRPRPGKILLLKNEKSEVAAIRVLKNYPGKFAGKIVLRFSNPQIGTEYRAIKKLGDKIIALIKEREKRGKDLDLAKSDEELAREVSPDDNELDRGIPNPKAKPKKPVKPEQPLTPTEGRMPEPLFNKEGMELGADGIEDKEEDEPYDEVSVQEELPLEPLRHAVSLQYAAMKNVDKDNNPATYSGIGIRYAFNFWRMPMWKRKSFQDMFSAELGLFYYAISDFGVTGDSVTVTPIVGTIRYSLLIGESFSAHAYLGFVRNNASQPDAALSTSTAILSTTNAALGIGAMVKIGPAWAARLDFGTDLFGIGAVLKF